MIKDSKNKSFKALKEGEDVEDSTQYGEFVTSYFAWVGLDKQREIVNRIENITKKNNFE